MTPICSCLLQRCCSRRFCGWHHLWRQFWQHGVLWRKCPRPASQHFVSAFPPPGRNRAVSWPYWSHHCGTGKAPGRIGTKLKVQEKKYGCPFPASNIISLNPFNKNYILLNLHIEKHMFAWYTFSNEKYHGYNYIFSGPSFRYPLTMTLFHQLSAAKERSWWTNPIPT